MTTSSTASEMVEMPVDLKNLLPGSVLDMETKSRHYLIECLGGNSIRVSGHPDYCPDPVPAELASISKEGGVELGRIGPGMPLMILLNGTRPITTSRVLSISLDDSKTSAPPRFRLQ